MRHRVTIQRVTITLDSYGEPTETWATWNTVWAEVSPLSGREYFASAQTQADTTHRVRMRYIDGLLVTDQFVYDGRTFTIDSIQDIGERNRELVVMVTESL